MLSHIHFMDNQSIVKDYELDPYITRNDTSNVINKNLVSDCFCFQVSKKVDEDEEIVDQDNLMETDPIIQFKNRLDLHIEGLTYNLKMKKRFELETKEDRESIAFHVYKNMNFIEFSCDIHEVFDFHIIPYRKLIQKDEELTNDGDFRLKRNLNDVFTTTRCTISGEFYNENDTGLTLQYYKHVRDEKNGDKIKLRIDNMVKDYNLYEVYTKCFGEIYAQHRDKVHQLVLTMNWIGDFKKYISRIKTTALKSLQICSEVNECQNMNDIFSLVVLLMGNYDKTNEKRYLYMIINYSPNNAFSEEELEECIRMIDEKNLNIVELYIQFSIPKRSKKTTKEEFERLESKYMNKEVLKSTRGMKIVIEIYRQVRLY